MKPKTPIIISVYVSITFFLLSSTTSTQSSCDSPVVGGHTGAPGETGCNGCHAGTANSGNAIIDFDMGTATYVPGQTYTGFVRIQQGGLDKFGFSCLALKNSDHTTTGSFGLVETVRTRIYADGNRNYMSHTPCGADSLDANSWNFTWTAPNTNEDTITLYIGALAANHNHATSGDYGYTRTFVLMPQLTNSISHVRSNALQVYPNPVADKIFINGIASEKVKTISVTDISGKAVIENLRTEGANPITISLDKHPALSSGVYFLNVSTTENVYTQKIIKE
ncbi:MAG: choice-of-anchor V domain-containing protein [Bacteroidia bacterium]